MPICAAADGRDPPEAFPCLLDLAEKKKAERERARERDAETDGSKLPGAGAGSCRSHLFERQLGEPGPIIGTWRELSGRSAAASA